MCSITSNASITLGPFVFNGGLTGPEEDIGKFRPAVGGAHVDHPDGLHARPRRLDAEQSRRLAALHTPPELFLRRQKEVLRERVGRNGDLDPFAASGNDREHRLLGIGDPHVVLNLGHVLLGRGLFGE